METTPQNGHVAPQDTAIGTRVRFMFEGGREAILPLVDTYFELLDLRDKCEAESKSHLDYLRGIVAGLQAQTGVVVTLGEADEFVDKVVELYLAKKKRSSDAIEGMLTSPRSTQASTRSG